MNNNFLKPIRQEIQRAVKKWTRPMTWPATILGAGSRTGFTRVGFSNGTEMEILNTKFSSVSGLKVRVGYDPLMPGELQVLGIRERISLLGTATRYLYWIIDHHKNHEFPGHDTVYVHGAQFLPMLVAAMGGFKVGVFNSILRGDETWFSYTSETLDLTSHVPTAGALYCLIEVDSTGTVTVTDGTEKASRHLLELTDIPAPTAERVSLAAISLYAGQDEIRQDTRSGKRNDILDLRFSNWNRASGGGVPAQTAYRIVITDADGNITTSAALRYNLTTKSFIIGDHDPGATASEGDLEMWGPDGENPSLIQHAAGASNAPALVGYATDGTDASKSAVASGKDLYRFVVLAYDGSAYATVARMYAVATENHDTGDHHGTKWVIYATPNNSGSTAIPVAEFTGTGINLLAGMSFSIDGDDLSVIFAPIAHVSDTGNPHSVTAAQAVAIPESGWIEISATWTRTGNHTFTVSGDVTSTYRKGMKVRYKDSASGSNYEYGVILSSSYSPSSTTVTLFTNDDYAMASGSITSPALSDIENPQGYPQSFNYTPATTNFTLGNGSVTGKFAVDGNRVTGFTVITLGSTSAVTGGVTFALPGGTVQESANVPIGTASFVDTGTAQYSGIVVPSSNTGLFKRFTVSGSAIQQANLSSSAPFTWGSTDYMTASFGYSF